MIGVQLLAAVLPGTRPLWVSPNALFGIVVVAASLCVGTAVAAIVVAHRNSLAELGLIGAFTFAVSMLPLVHGLTTPGVLYGANSATMSSVFWALPFASIAAIPLMAPSSGWSRALTRHWRPFVLAHVLVVAAVAVALLVTPSLLAVPTMSSWTAIVAACASLSVCFGLSTRQLRLAWIANSREPLFVSLGFGMVGVSSLVWVARAPFTAGFWLAHLFDIAGVFLLSVGAALVYRQRPSLRAVIRPLVVHSPLAAFELGLEPLVHEFVRTLETKDQITRDHVARTAELALHVGAELGLPATELHVLGLGALLHDIGKLSIPNEIIEKPGRLDDSEFAVMRGHAAAGEAMVRRSEVLAPIGPIVRGHHERLDGDGYPDGLHGDAIPLSARIVSACDAFDAMANTRQYREGMGTDRAISVLREHSGSQWDPMVVEALVLAIRRRAPSFTAFDRVGRTDAPLLDAHDWCSCVDALPPHSTLRVAVRAMPAFRPDRSSASACDTPDVAG